jgi:threonyl-tRNA synthetase
MPNLTLPDGREMDFDGPVTGKEVAEAIGKRLAKDALGVKVDGVVRDLHGTIDHDARVEILTPGTPEGLEMMRHSASHVMAEAILEVFPGTKLVYGPAIAEGFYYDVDAPAPITEEDLPRIEKAMKKIVKRKDPIVREDLTREAAKARVGDNEYKLDNIANAAGEIISFYRHGDHFEDLCAGPHVPSTGKIGAFKVLSVSGAYLHGDATQKQLTRVYGTTFATKDELSAYLTRIEEARRRDHRKLGRELGLFEFHPEAPGMAFWRHNGVVLRNGLIGYLRELCYARGYEETLTPQVLVKELWEASGHWDKFAEKMYITEKDGREYGLKPMNCPGGLVLYKAGLHSHNDLPLRWAEFGHVHRHESGGEIHGLVRVRGFTQDDAHHFCTPDQLQGEIAHCIEFIHEVYGTLGMRFDHIELSTRPEKRIGDDAAWDKAEGALQGALEQLGIAYTLNPGDGAFYGPKIDFHLADAIGRTWQMGTIQVDFALPERFDLHYVDENSARQRPVMIHRAVSGSIERFLGVLVEHFAGDFPLWLAPRQVRVLTITDAQNAGARDLCTRLRKAGLRAEADLGAEKVGAKIRRGELEKVPYIAIVGDQELADGTVSVRRRIKGDLGTVAQEEFIRRLEDEVKTKTLPEAVAW